ncbi:MAG: helix-turn-helix transcriptional regulator [Thermoguttaceae bacterium]|nr:helix-turn-helix transcriptional regulator [Thermoguttaceae bacterium]
MKDRLKQLRKTLGLKQREIAERLGVATGLVGSWESGSNEPGDARIYQICKEFRVRREWLEKGEGEMFEPEPDVRPLGEYEDLDVIKESIRRIYNLLPEDKRGAFRDYLSKLTDDKGSGAKIVGIETMQGGTVNQNFGADK